MLAPMLVLLLAAAEKPRVAVLEVVASDPSMAKRAAELEELALTELTRPGRLDVIGRSDVATLLGLERQKALLGCGDDGSCIAEIGAALGAPYLVTGRVGSAGPLMRVDLKLVEVASSRVLAREGQVIEEERDWYAATGAMLARLEAAVPGLGARTPTSSGRSPWPFVVAGAGALAGAGGGVLMALGASAANQALVDGRDGVALAPEVSRSFDQASTQHAIGVGLVAGGAAVAAVGVVLAFVLPGSSPPPVAVGPMPGGAFVSAQGSF